jgi:hypothetical protein
MARNNYLSLSQANMARNNYLSPSPANMARNNYLSPPQPIWPEITSYPLPGQHGQKNYLFPFTAYMARNNCMSPSLSLFLLIMRTSIKCTTKQNLNFCAKQNMKIVFQKAKIRGSHKDDDKGSLTLYKTTSAFLYST